GNLLIHAEPEVNACTDAVLPRDTEDRADCFIEARMRVLLGNAQTARQIVRSNQHRIEPLQGTDLVEVFDCRNALDVGDEDLLAVPFLQILGQLGFECVAIAECLAEPSSFQWAKFYRTHECPRLFCRFEIRADDSSGSGIKRLTRLERIIARNSYHWRQ